MRHATILALFVVLPAVARQVDTDAWRGRSLGIAVYPDAGLTLSTAGTEIITGATGGGVDASGRLIPPGMEPPALRIANALATLAHEHYGMIDAPRVPARHLDAPKDLARSAREVANVDVVLDVEANAGVTQNLFRSSFGVGMLVTARLIDVQTGKTLASSFCQQISKGAWSREELMANDAEKLKAAVAERADGCIEKFKASVLMIKPRDPGSN